MKKELKAATSAGWSVISKSDTNSHNVTLSNGWVVRVERVYKRYAAWSPSYTLLSPTGKAFGGNTSSSSFISQFGNPFAWQWRDDFRTNGYGK